MEIFRRVMVVLLSGFFPGSDSSRFKAGHPREFTCRILNDPIFRSYDLIDFLRVKER